MYPAGVLLSLSNKLPAAEPAATELVQPPHRGLLGSTKLKVSLRQLLMPSAAVAQHASPEAGAKYMRLRVASCSEEEDVGQGPAEMGTIGAVAASAGSAAGAEGVGVGAAEVQLAALPQDYSQQTAGEGGELHHREHTPGASG